MNGPAARPPLRRYDFDGDGIVGPKDYFIGRHFDAGTKGYLTTEERSAASAALRQGWIDQSRRKSGLQCYCRWY